MPSRLLIFDDRHDRVYGSQRTLVEHARGLGRDKTLTPVIGSSADGPFLASAAAAGLNTLVIPIRSGFLVYGKQLLKGPIRTRLSGVLALARSSLAFRTSCKAEGVDIVLAASIRPLLLALPARALGNVRLIWYVQNAEYFRFASYLGRLIADSIATVSPESDVAWCGREVSESDRLRCGARIVPVPRVHAPVEVITRVTDDDNTRLVVVGALIHRKGVDRAIVVANTIAATIDAPVRLVVVGDCPHDAMRAFEAELHEAAGKGVATIDFVGWQSDVASFIRGAHALLFLSRSDAWGRVVAEALSLGVPVMGCEDLGAVRALIRHRTNGWAVPQSDSLEQASIDVARDLVDHDRTTMMSDAAMHTLTSETVGTATVDPIAAMAALVADTLRNQTLARSLRIRMCRFRLVAGHAK